MEHNGTNRLVKNFGARLQQELAVENRLPFRIALMVEHLRRAEDEMKAVSTSPDLGASEEDAKDLQAAS